jgi:gamma-glutamyltranspeptidase/glutathione hydrolase
MTPCPRLWHEVHADSCPRPGHAEKHTTHWSVADAEGNWVAVTATVNTSFGSKVVIPGTGVVMNNEMDVLHQLGVPNAFGLIGADANAVAPGKRRLQHDADVVLKNGKPIIALGAAGGPIITAVLMELIYMLDLGMSAQERCRAAHSSSMVAGRIAGRAIVAAAFADSAATARA